MELTMKYVVAIILGIVVLAALTYMLVSTNKSSNLSVSMKFQQGCQILSRNGCDLGFEIEDGKTFEEFLKENGYDEEEVKKQCCVE